MSMSSELSTSMVWILQSVRMPSSSSLQQKGEEQEGNKIHKNKTDFALLFRNKESKHEREGGSVAIVGDLERCFGGRTTAGARGPKDVQAVLGVPRKNEQKMNKRMSKQAILVCNHLQSALPGLCERRLSPLP